ncbi:MAG TPA: ornithine cyclodeaminase family protein [Candidatus Sulfotelmatobacter sp.]|jgi:alanine dehydrogenase|nr:ornithine cyclodeaminase family protein [Candidatus Sulfotelmatobacter sp.]
MTLHINEAEVRELLTMPMAMEAVEEISRKQAAGSVILHPRRRFELPAGGGFFHYMAAMDTEAGFIAMKQYTYVKGALRFLVPLYEISTGALLALIEADFMGQQRTGAASGVATKYLARQNARTAAILGTGGQAKTQLEAVAAARKLESVRVYGRDAERRARFCAEMSRRLGIPVHAAVSAAEAVRGADIINTATTSANPVFDGRDIGEGAHVNAIGANHAHKRELDDIAISRAAVVFVDSIEQSKQEAGDLIIPFEQQPEKWDTVHELDQLVAGKVPGRANDKQITLFKSNGIASWDLAVAEKVYALAKQKNLGRELPFFFSGK